jgi:hypothetical protein
MKEKKFSKYQDIFSSFIKESKQHKTLISRSYREVITDAMEAAFPLNNLNEEDYEINLTSVDKLNFSEKINKAVQIEEACKKFCIDAKESLTGLLADVPEEFGLVTERKNLRIKKLKSF